MDYFNNNLVSLSKLGKIVIEPTLETYVLTKEVGKVNLNVLSIPNFIALFSLPVIVEHGTVTFYLAKEESTFSLSIKYSVSLSSTVFKEDKVNNINGIIDKLRREIEIVVGTYREVKSLELISQKMTENTKAPNGVSMSYIEDLLNNLNKGKENREDEDNSKQ